MKNNFKDKGQSFNIEKIKRLAFFTESNPRPVVEVNLKGRIIYTNPSTGISFPDIRKGRHKYLSDFKKIKKSLIQNKKEYFSREIEIHNKWFKQFFYYVPRFKSIIIYAVDITDQKNAERDIKISEKRYHMLFEKMNYGYALQDIIFDTDKKIIDYRFIDINPAFEKLLKLKKENILGKTANEMAENPQNKENIENRKKYDKVALTGKPTYFERYDKKLDKYFQLYAYKPNERQIALITSDITRLKKIDEEKNNFISIMSHELRNPLTPILANAQFINSILQKEKIKYPLIGESIDIIEKEAKIMADLLNDILDASKLSRKKIKLKKTRINICNVIKNSIKTSMPFINTKHQKLSVFFGQDPIYMYADPLRINQIMVNIINNASKYTQPNGHIILRCDIKNKKIEISVKDNGVGMRPEKINRIFELFVDESQPFMGVGGLGIGLNIVKNLVSMHEGIVSVHSEGKNKGSEFFIRFPASNNSARATTQKKTKKVKIYPKEKKLKVLIVDDNEDILNAISKILRFKGHKIKTTSSGVNATKIYKTFKPDTALIDIGLPDINGYKVAKILRKQNNSESKKIKLIALTGYGQKKDKELSYEAGFDYHITKPIDINQLIKLI